MPYNLSLSTHILLSFVEMSEPNVIVADNSDQVSQKLKELIEAEADRVLKSSDTSILVIGLSGLVMV